MRYLKRFLIAWVFFVLIRIGSTFITLFAHMVIDGAAGEGPRATNWFELLGRSLELLDRSLSFPLRELGMHGSYAYQWSILILNSALWAGLYIFIHVRYIASGGNSRSDSD
jgi:hypothetical protein